jgi:predicted phosphodiesterase/transposase
MTVPIDPLEFIKKCNSGWKTKKLANHFDCSVRTIRNYKQKFRERGLINDDRDLNQCTAAPKKRRAERTPEKSAYTLDIASLLSADELIRLLNVYESKNEVARQLGITRQRLNKLFKKHGILDRQEIDEKFVYQLNAALNSIPVYKSMPREKDVAPEHFVTHFTDWHAGKRVIRENDKVTYDTDIFRARVDRMLERTLYLLGRHVKFGTNIGTVDILNTGDMANGENIYPGQEYQQEAAPPDQVMLVVEAQVKYITALLKEGYPVRVHCVKGNHGRTSKESDPASNWDLMIYKILDFWQRKNKVDNCEIIYTESDYLNTDINGWKYHLRHIAFEQGDTSAGRSRFHGWGAMHDCDALVFGHWHHWGCFPVDHIRVFRGGSLVGPDEFSDKLGKSSLPIQLVWGVPKNRVSSFVYPVDLN